MAKRSSIQSFQENAHEGSVVCLRQRQTMISQFDHEAADQRSRGAPPEKGQGFVRHWELEYNWRMAEDTLTPWPHFMTRTDGIDTNVAAWEEPGLFLTGIKVASGLIC